MAQKKLKTFKAGVLNNIDRHVRIKWFGKLVDWLPNDVLFEDKNISYKEEAIHVYLYVLQNVFPPDSIEELLDDDPCYIEQSKCIQSLNNLFADQKSHPAYISIVKELKNEGEPVDGRGICLHFDNTFDKIMKVWNI